MSGEFSPDWLRLREPADADARAGDLVDLLRPYLNGPLVIRDLGCGTGSMSRWLAPRLPGPQHWVLVDRDRALLDRAAAGLPKRAADGTPVTGETRIADVTALTTADLAGTSLVTCSALLDLLTEGELGGITAALTATATPALFTLSVTGEVRFDPLDPLDTAVAAAFDEHQRRTVDGRRLLGPDAPTVTERALAAGGARVTTRTSAWHLGPDRAELAAAWLDGWTAAAAEQRPDLPIAAYRANRLAEPVTVTVGHRDLLAVFPG
jgi:hypothetical protein